MSPTGIDFPLAGFERLIQADDTISGMLYTGSLGRGTGDRYSDLDIECWVDEGALTDLEAAIERLLGYLGTMHFRYPRGPLAVTAFVGPEWQRTDLVLHPTSDRTAHAEYHGARIIKDRDGFLAPLVAGAPGEDLAITRAGFAAVIAEAIDSQIYLALHNARGAAWSAMGEVSYHLAELYTALARLRGRSSYGFRYVETLLSASERDLLARAWPVSADRVEVRRAARALWTWTEYVWAEAERHLGGDLGIELDRPALLAAVERLYEGSAESDAGSAEITDR